MYRSCGARKPIQTKDGGPFLGRGFAVQSVSFQLKTNANEMVLWVKNEFHQFFQEAYPIILFPVYYVQ